MTRTSPCIAVLVAASVAVLSADQSPSDLDHIRTGLEKPPSTLTLPPPPAADFHVHIEERHPYTESFKKIFDVPPWMPEKPGWQPPTAFNVMSVVGSIVQSIRDAKRGHDERVAREEVQRAIADYCAAQPNNGTNIQICARSTPVVAGR